jgi:hypothetical protein
MSRRITGSVLLGISAFLYATRYLTAAILGSSIQNWNTDLFNAMLKYVGREPILWSTIALIAGIIYLAWTEVEAFLKSR